MGTDVGIGCKCGAVTAVARHVAPASSNFVICGCKFCRGYAHYLGHADDVLDAHGGTEIFQISPRCLEIIGGRENIACLRMTEKGALRWYASCCNTPLANTAPSAALPLMGLTGMCIDPDLRPVFGRLRARINSDPGAPDTGRMRSAFMLFRYACMMVMWRLRGDYKHSPLFDVDSGAPVLAPRVLTSPERKDALSRAL